jgi:chromosome segregation ATPase
MDPNERTIQILEEMRDSIKDIRDEARQTNVRLERVENEAVATNARLDQTNARLDQTNARLDQTNARLDQQAAAIAGLESAVVHELGATNALLERQTVAIAGLDGAVRSLGARIDNVFSGALGSTVRDLELRVTRLEQKA